MKQVEIMTKMQFLTMEENELVFTESYLKNTIEARTDLTPQQKRLVYYACLKEISSCDKNI